MLYKKGEVISIGKTYIIFETNNKGFLFHVAMPNNFKDKTQIKLFVYIHKTDHAETYFGFQTFAERLLFTDLISISGIGPKTSLQVLRKGYKNVIGWIANENHEELAAISWVGSRTASQIIFELKNKYKTMSDVKKVGFDKKEFKTALSTLGFNKKQITYAITNIDLSKKIDIAIEDAIKAIASA